MKRKLRLGLDLDGVVYRWQHTAIYLLNTHRNLDLSYDKWYKWGYLKEKTSKEDWNWLWKEGVEEHGLFRYGSIYKGSREFLKEIEPFCNNVVITSRPANAKQDTMDWLAYQKLPTSEIHIVGAEKLKSDVEPWCDVYIDDAIHNANDLLENTKGLVIIPDRPWNQEFPNKVTGWERASSWDEIKHMLIEIHREIND